MEALEVEEPKFKQLQGILLICLLTYNLYSSYLKLRSFYFSAGFTAHPSMSVSLVTFPGSTLCSSMVNAFSSFRLATWILCEAFTESSSFLANSLTSVVLEVLIQVITALVGGVSFPQKLGLAGTDKTCHPLSDKAHFHFCLIF